MSAGDQGNIDIETKSRITSVNASVTSVTLLLANPSRHSFIITNESATAVLFVKYGEEAAIDSYTRAIDPGDTWAPAVEPSYTGQVDGIWELDDGAAIITELLI